MENKLSGSDQQSLIPQIYAEKMHVARSSRSMQGERRVVSILFCDVVGSTEMAGQLDPEIWAEIMQEAFDYMVTPVYRYEGTVARLMGDGVLAFFGAPIAHEDDAERAVRAGLEILSGIQTFAEDIKEEFGADFDVRVGINTGPVVVGEIGTDLAMEYTAMGDATNIAARMEQTAQAGSVQITEDTYKRVKPLFISEPLGRVELKGKGSPIPAYRITGVKARPGRTRGIEGLGTPFVGRETELERIKKALHDLEAGHGAILTLVGGAGLGKSRLIDEASSWAHEQSNIKSEWMYATGVSYNMSLPYGVFRSMLRRLIGVEGSSPPSKTLLKVREFVVRLPGDQRIQVQRAIELILGLANEADFGDMDAENRKRQVFMAIFDLFRWIGQTAPTVIVLDDLHWADAVSVELITHLFSLTDEIPVMYLCSLRPHRSAAGWEIKLHGETEYPHRYDEIVLKPLSADQSEELIEALLSVSNLPASMRDLMKSKAEGNPFFVEEVIRMLIEQDIIKRDEDQDQWVAVKEPEEVIIPDNLNALLTARIDRLPPGARMTLQYAAVIGRSFNHPVLASVVELNGRLQEQLSILQRYELIREVRRVPIAEYIFTHELTRDAAYSTLLRRQRRLFHQKVGETFEDLYGDREEEFAGRLGYHFKYAGLLDRARNYFIKAGDHAANLYANDEAIKYYRSVLEIIQQDEIGYDSWTHLLLKLGRVHEVMGNWDQALALYRQIEAQGVKQDDPEMELDGLLHQVTIYSVPTNVRDYASSIDLADRALKIAEALEKPNAIAKTLWNMFLLHFYQGIEVEEGVKFGERALAIARKHKLDELLPFILNDLGRAYSSSHQYSEARDAQEESETIWRSIGNLPMLADNLTTGADMLLCQGEFSKAEDLAKEALEISKQIGNLWGQAYSMMVYGGIKLERGQISDGIEMIQECKRIGKEGNFAAASMFSPLYLAWIYAWAGSPDIALDYALEAIGLLDELPVFKARADILLAKIYQNRGDQEKAYALVEGARDQMEIVVPDMLANTLAWSIVGEIMLSNGEIDGALATVERLESIAKRNGGLWNMPDVYLLKSAAMFASGQKDQGTEWLLAAKEESERIGSRRSQLIVAAACVEHLGSYWDPQQASRFAEDSKALIEELEFRIEDEELKDTFMHSGPVVKLQRWIETQA